MKYMLERNKKRKTTELLIPVSAFYRFPSMEAFNASTPFERKLSVRWAQLIKQAWLEDSLLCPECGDEMQILSFITKAWVVDRI